MKTEYFLIVASSARNLSEQVNKFLTDGWILFGHPFSDSSNEETRLCQAVARVSDEEITKR
jgi:hypothetical protein